MSMNIYQAKQTVIEAGKQLLECGLIVRTWGNISCRISESEFVITPSGKPYHTLTPKDIVIVKIDDLSYSGNVKPSSEKGIHADCYKTRPDVNFVIHTHQTNASALSVLKRDICTDIESDCIGNVIPCADYGLPGQSKLRKGVKAAVERSSSKAILMAHHGALCMGESYDEAFRVANELERVCGEYIKEKFKREPFENHAHPSESEYSNGVIHFKDEYWDTDVSEDALDLTPEQCIHRDIYAAYPKIKHIIHTADDDVTEASAQGKKIAPYLDDFAQLVGLGVKTAKTSAKLVGKLRFRNAVLLKNNGGYCCAGDKYNAEAVETVLSKNCKTYIDAQQAGNIKPLSTLDSLLMRVVYKLKYSKQAE